MKNFQNKRFQLNVFDIVLAHRNVSLVRSTKFHHKDFSALLNPRCGCAAVNAPLL